jgi:hypothetical protein
MVQTIHERRKSPMKYWEWHCKQRRMCVYHFYFTSTIVPAMVLFLHLWYNSSREIALCIADVMKNYWYIGWYTTVQKADKIREKRTFFLHPISNKNTFSKRDSRSVTVPFIVGGKIGRGSDHEQEQSNLCLQISSKESILTPRLVIANND